APRPRPLRPARFLRAQSLTFVRDASDPHRHDDVGVVVAFRADWFDHRLAHLILELEPDVLGFDDAQKVVDVVRVEADLHRVSAVVDRYDFVRLAYFRSARRDFDLVFADDELHGFGTL